MFAEWNQETPCATPPAGLLCGHLDESTLLTGYEPNFCIDVSSEHTPIKFPFERSFSTDVNDLATTVDASEIIDTTEVGQFDFTTF